MKKTLDYLITEILLPPLFYAYERWLMYRIRRAWGIVHERNIKNKGLNVKLIGYSRFLNTENLTLGNNIKIGYE